MTKGEQQQPNDCSNRKETPIRGGTQRETHQARGRDGCCADDEQRLGIFLRKMHFGAAKHPRTQIALGLNQAVNFEVLFYGSKLAMLRIWCTPKRDAA